MVTPYQPLFPYFGGKSKIAHIAWRALGNPRNYIEPFFGSGAVLFMRPSGPGQIETVNDMDCFISNLFRAVQADPSGVAKIVDYPVNEADLHARHLWLLGERDSIQNRIMGDPSFYDIRVAGWWVWGVSAWIGSGWCSGNGPCIS